MENPRNDVMEDPCSSSDDETVFKKKVSKKKNKLTKILVKKKEEKPEKKTKVEKVNTLASATSAPRKQPPVVDMQTKARRSEFVEKVKQSKVAP